MNRISCKVAFPKGFLWGVGYSAHQVEGNNTNNDWSQWEKEGKTREVSGIACDSWNRYGEDHDLAAGMGCNAFRISLEWSRIETEEGVFCQEVIEHYRDVLRDMGSKGMSRVVTLNHWTVPAWFANQYGWHNRHSITLYRRYVDHVIRELRGEMDLVLTFNEPRLFLNQGYILGRRPPGYYWRVDLFWRARRNLEEAHRQAYRVIKHYHPYLSVGFTQFVNGFSFFGKKTRIPFVNAAVEHFYNWRFFDKTRDFCDFVGLNYYFDVGVSFRKPHIRLIVYERREATGFRDLLLQTYHRYHKPLYIFENGTPDEADNVRSDFLRHHTDAIFAALKLGADVRGYFHWSLLDNYEWDAGYSMKFGLYSVERSTLERGKRAAVKTFAAIIKKHRGL